LVKDTFFEFDSIGNDGDYVHLLVCDESKYFPARMMQIVKKYYTKKIFKECYEI